jgi:hypothetical protein
MSVMSQQLGRGESRPWPAKRPVSSLVALGIVVAIGIEIFTFRNVQMWTPLQGRNWTEYLTSKTSSMTRGDCRLLEQVDAHRKQLMALAAAAVPGPLQGWPPVPVAPALKVDTMYTTSAEMNQTLAESIYKGPSPDDLVPFAWVGWLGIFVLGLVLGIRRNRARARMLAHGRRLKGPQMVTVQEFNQWSGGSGIGFVTTQGKQTLAIPRSLESSHIMIMGDTGAGKSVLQRRVLMQIAGRQETAIVYDPALEYTSQFFNPARGDLILNPLDARCPYWSPCKGSVARGRGVDAGNVALPRQAVREYFFRGRSPKNLRALADAEADTGAVGLVDEPRGRTGPTVERH